MIKEVEGNILDTDCFIICQQVNCMGVMGSGLAKQIMNKWPTVYTEYKSFCNMFNSPEELIGQVNFVSLNYDNLEEYRMIANLFGQLNYGRNKNIVYTDYNALKDAFINLKCHFIRNHKIKIAIPYGIGCGLANGSWNKVYKIIEDVFKDYDNYFDVFIYKYDKID